MRSSSFIPLKLEINEKRKNSKQTLDFEVWDEKFRFAFSLFSSPIFSFRHLRFSIKNKIMNIEYAGCWYIAIHHSSLKLSPFIECLLCKRYIHENWNRGNNLKKKWRTGYRFNYISNRNRFDQPIFKTECHHVQWSLVHAAKMNIRIVNWTLLNGNSILWQNFHSIFSIFMYHMIYQDSLKIKIFEWFQLQQDKKWTRKRKQKNKTIFEFALSTSFIVNFVEKDTCKLAFNTVWWKVTAAVSIDENDIHNVIANVTLSFNLQKRQKQNIF